MSVCRHQGQLHHLGPGRRIDEIENNVFAVPSRINSTWGGSLVDMVRSSKIMDIIEEDGLCNNAEQMGNYLQQQLTEISGRRPVISNIRGKGLLTAFDFPDKAMRDKFLSAIVEL